MAVDTIAGLKQKMPAGVPGGISVQDIHDFIDTMGDRTSQDVLIKTASYTVTADDNRRRIIMNSASATTLTLPASLPAGFECFVSGVGAGAVTIAVTGGNLRSRDNHTRLAGQYSAAYLVVYANTGSTPQVLFAGDTAL